MAYFYVEAGGTRTSGGGQTKKTGAWSSIAAGDKYDTPETCSDDASPPVSGDIVCWKTDSTDTASVDTSVTFANGVTLIATSASNCDQYEKSTSEQMTADAGDFYYIGGVVDEADNLIFHGVNWAPGDTLMWNACNKHILSDCTLSMNRDHPALLSLANATRIVAVDSSMTGPYIATKEVTNIADGAELVLLSGDYTGIAASAVIVEFQSDGGRFYARGTDFSGSGSGAVIMAIAGVADTLCHAHYFKCDLPTSWTTTNIDLTSGAALLVESCDSRYQYEQITYAGDISWVEDVYYTSHSTMDDGTTKGSLYFDANANCSPYAPLKYGDYSSGRWLMKDNQAAATTNTLRVFFVTHSADSLDKGDIQIECMYADTADTSKVLFAKHINPIINDSPGALDTETTTAKWTDSGSNSLATTSYYFDLDLTSEGNGLVYWTLALTKADVEMWLSWECEFV